MISRNIFGESETKIIEFSVYHVATTRVKVDFTEFLSKFMWLHPVKQSLVNLLLFIITSSRKSFGEVVSLLALPPSDDRKLRCSGVDKFLKVEKKAVFH